MTEQEYNIITLLNIKLEKISEILYRFEDRAPTKDDADIILKEFYDFLPHLQSCQEKVKSQDAIKIINDIEISLTTLLEYLNI